jgi:hypothetical protein
VPAARYRTVVRRLPAVLLLLTGGCVTACTAPETGGAGASPGTTSREVISRSAGPQPAGTSAAATADTPWDRLLAEGRPGDELTAAQAGLPGSYLPDRGEDDYDKPRRELVRRDMAAYLLRLRHQDVRGADALAWQLQVIPAAWCSLVLPARSPEEFDRQLVAANRRGQDLARALKVDFTPPVSAAEQALLRQARQAAAGQFCPAQAAAPGKPVADRVAPPARFPDGTAHVDILQTALPEYYALNEHGAGTPRIPHEDLHQGYVDILAGTARVDSRSWPTALPCDQTADLLQPAEVQEYADRLLEGMRAGWLSRRQAASRATDFAGDSFALLERGRVCAQRR